MIITRYLSLGAGIKGVTVKDENDDFNIYINSNLSDAQQKEALQHEVAHIYQGHFFDDRPVMVKEEEADGKSTKAPIREMEHPNTDQHNRRQADI